MDKLERLKFKTKIVEISTELLAETRHKTEIELDKILDSDISKEEKHKRIRTYLDVIAFKHSSQLIQRVFDAYFDLLEQ